MDLFWEHEIDDERTMRLRPGIAMRRTAEISGLVEADC